MKKIFYISLLVIAILSMAGQAENLSQQKIEQMFDQANSLFRQANQESQNASQFYDKTALLFEQIISQGNIENAKLYYNLGNVYLLKKDVARAILNYRRAEKLDKSDGDLQKNLAFAREMRVDNISKKTGSKIWQMTFAWHYDLSMKSKFKIGCLMFVVACIAIAGRLFVRKKTIAVIAAAGGIVMICMLISIIIEKYVDANTVCGVIVAKQVTARQGDGQNYPESFDEPLHGGVEFKLIEKRPKWLFIELANQCKCWIPDNTAEFI